MNTGDSGAAAPDSSAGRYLAIPVVAAVSLLITLAVFSPCIITGTFIESEDSVLRLPLMSHAGHVDTIFTQHFMAYTEGQYRPLPYALLATVRTVIGADNIIFWNLWLVAFHVLNATLIYAIVRRFSRHPVASLTAAGIFLLHPLASAFAGQINNFHYVLGGSLYLAGFLCYLRGVEKRSTGSYIASMALLVAGLFTSSALVTLPVLMLLYEFAYLRKNRLAGLARILPPVSIVAVFLLLFGSMRAHPMLFVYPPNIHSGLETWWVYSLVTSGIDNLFGFLTAHHYTIPVMNLTGEFGDKIILGSIAVVLLGWFAYGVKRFRERDWMLIGLFLLFLTVITRIGDPQNMTIDLASWSYRYMALVGFAMLIGALVDRALAVLKPVGCRVCMAAAAAVVLAFACFLVVANVSSRTPTGYWSYTVGRNPASQVARLQLGKAYLAEGNLKKALEHLFSPIAQAGAVRRGCFAMARYYRELARTDTANAADWRLAALAHLGIAKHEDGYGQRYTDYYNIMADIHHDTNALDFAEQALGWVLMTDRFDSRAIRHLAELHETKGYVISALGLREAAARISPDDRRNRRGLQMLRKYATKPVKTTEKDKLLPPSPSWLRHSSNQGRTPEAAEGLLRIAAKHPEDPIVLLSAAIVCGENNLHATALEWTARALDIESIGPSDLLPALQRASGRLSSFSYAWATACWAAGNQLDAMAAAGSSISERAFFNAAMVSISKVKRLEPRDSKTWLQLAKILSETQSRYAFTLARGCYLKALQGDPRSFEGYNNLGALLTESGQHAKAVRCFRKALELSNDKTATAHKQLGITLRKAGKPREAIVHCRKALELDDQIAPAYRGLAKAYQMIGEDAQAIEVLLKGIERIPKDVALKVSLANLLSTTSMAGLRDGKRAIQLASAARESSDKITANMLDVLAAAYAQDGQYARAVDTANDAIAILRKEQEDLKSKNLPGELAQARQKQLNKTIEMLEQHRDIYRSGRPYPLPKRRPFDLR